MNHVINSLFYAHLVFTEFLFDTKLGYFVDEQGQAIPFCTYLREHFEKAMHGCFQCGINFTAGFERIL
jgi:hypothetical protein